MDSIVLFNHQSNDHSMENREAWSSLHQAGFVDREISQIIELRRAYLTGQTRYEVTVLRRLQFVRWLVQTGRLTEMVIGEEEPPQEYAASP
jgi:hypothetical protein